MCYVFPSAIRFLWTEIKIETSTGNLKLRNEIGKFKENI